MYQLAGVVAQSVRSKALIHEVVGLNLAVTSSVLPKLGGRTCTWGTCTIEPTNMRWYWALEGVLLLILARPLGADLCPTVKGI